MRLSPASDAGPVDPSSPEPMDTSPAEPDAVDAEQAAPDAGAVTTAQAAPVRRRNRPALSCIQCRSRKVRCDRNEPCNSCLKSKILNCTYEEARRPKAKYWKLPATKADPWHGTAAVAGPDYLEVRDDRESHAHRSPALMPGPSRAADAPVSSGSAGRPLIDGAASAASATSISPSDSSALALKVKELEEKLADALKRQGGPQPPPNPPVPAVLSKTRYFGASHWMTNSMLFPLIMSMHDRVKADTNSEVSIALDKCKKMGRIIKAHRNPDSKYFEIGKFLPAESVALRLVEAYFRTFESVYRILHVPSFWADYQKFWSNPAGADPAFLIQLQLCMAIGTCFQDDVAVLRSSATKWVFEAQRWLASPVEKSRMTLTGLQCRCLLHLARETCGVGGDLTWISVGATLRTAMYMGLHRDPEHLPTMSLLASELRRRLWATILELLLQSSLTSGGPPLLSLSDFDTRPPSNYDDDQLVEGSRFTSGPRPPGTFTQTSVQIALLKSFAIRLSIVQHVNDFHGTPSYDETLRRNSELSVACRTLAATLQASYDPAGVIPNRVSLFQLQMTELMLHYFFLALNMSWMTAAHNNPAYYFARKMAIETSLKLFRSYSKDASAGDPQANTHASDFTKLIMTGAGVFRAVALQVLFALVVELLWQTTEDRTFRQSMGLDLPGLVAEPDAGASALTGNGVASRAELMEALNFAEVWAETRVRRGETNVKGYIFHGALVAQIEGIQRGLSESEIERNVFVKLRERAEHSLMLLKDIAGGGSSTPSDVTDATEFSSSEGVSRFDGDRLDDFGFGINAGNDWNWVWDDLGFNMPNFNY
ncbi:hypothetical protein GQ53DRAFT_834507 [Thozetella sp. PMI_491]|nr:hypothetical protein GQ53DRAFT_834507 [Thozetella sp. PMI_491]